MTVARYFLETIGRNCGTVRGPATTLKSVTMANAPENINNPNPASAATQGAHWKSSLRFFVPLLIGAALVAALEGGLCLGGYGWSERFFQEQEIGGARMLVYNPHFARRFFPEQWPIRPYPFAFPAEKAENTRRIFIFGESAAYGFPDAAFSFSRILQVMLEAHYPGTRFEVINTAMPAINAHVMLPIARECARYQPDLFVIYAGNNEIIGPFGPGGDLGNPGQPLFLIRLQIALRATRTAQLLQALAHAIGRNEEAPSWGDMRMWLDRRIRWEDPRRENARAKFERNLRTLCRIARRADAGVVLCTMAENLKDFSPLASMHHPGMDDAAHAAWQAFVEEGDAMASRGEWANALGRYTRAAKLDDTHAALQFRIGQCHWALKGYDAARLAFDRARDLDTLRFRADSAINESIRLVAAENMGKGTALADVEKTFAAQSAEGIPGENLFHDHCHPNFTGNHTLARAVFEQTHALLGGAPLTAGSPAAPPVHEQECAERLGMTPLQQKNHLQYVLLVSDKPPFSDRFDHPDWKKRLQDRIDALAPQIEPDRLRQYAVWFREMLARKRSDPMIHRNYAQVLRALGNPQAAAEQWRLAAEMIPHSGEIWLELGRTLLDAGDAPAAAESLARAAELTPLHAETHRDHAKALQQAGHNEEALAAYRTFIALHPRKGEAYWMLGAAQEAMGDLPGAIQTYREGIAADPAHAGLHYYLGKALRQQGDTEAAIAEWRRGMEKQPDNYGIYVILAETLERMGDRPGLLETYSAMVALRPDDAALHFRLGVVQEALDKLDAAIASFERVVAIDPQRVDAQGRIALLRWRMGDAEGALEAVRRCEAMGGQPPPGLPEEIAPPVAGRKQAGEQGTWQPSP